MVLFGFIQAIPEPLMSNVVQLHPHLPKDAAQAFERTKELMPVIRAVVRGYTHENINTLVGKEFIACGVVIDNEFPGTGRIMKLLGETVIAMSKSASKEELRAIFQEYNSQVSDES